MFFRHKPKISSRFYYLKWSLLIIHVIVLILCALLSVSIWFNDTTLLVLLLLQRNLPLCKLGIQGIIAVEFLLTFNGILVTFLENLKLSIAHSIVNFLLLVSLIAGTILNYEFCIVLLLQLGVTTLNFWFVKKLQVKKSLQSARVSYVLPSLLPIIPITSSAVNQPIPAKPSNRERISQFIQNRTSRFLWGSQFYDCENKF